MKIRLDLTVHGKMKFTNAAANNGNLFRGSGAEALCNFRGKGVFVRFNPLSRKMDF